MVEAYGENKDAAVSCFMWRNSTFSISKLREASVVCNGAYWKSEPERAARQRMDGYAAEGYSDELQYPQTLDGLRKWTVDYLMRFPRFRALSTNCQKYSTGVYNAITHSHTGEDQEVLTSIGVLSSAIGSAIVGSVKASGSLEATTPEPSPQF